MDDSDKSQTVDHANADLANFAVVETIIDGIEGESVENLTGIRKSYAVLRDVLPFFVVVPFKFHSYPYKLL